MDTHTSAKVRIAAVRAIEEMERPITAHELEFWISQNDSDLWQEVSQKCYDYVRIILSLTPNTLITKYKTPVHIPGIDKRAAFYGLSDNAYDQNLWEPARRKKTKRKHKEKLTVTESHKTSIFYSSEYAPQFEYNVDDQQYSQAWYLLTTFIEPEDPFWSIFHVAVKDMKSCVQKGEDPDLLLQSILNKSPDLQHPIIVESVVTILSRAASAQNDMTK